MRYVDYIKWTSPENLARRLKDLYDEINEVSWIKSFYGDFENNLKDKKNLVDSFWQNARKQKDFSEPIVSMFIKLAGEYKQLCKSDRKQKLMEAEYREKLLNYQYADLIDKKYWTENQLLDIAEYLSNGKARTIEQAIKLYEAKK